MDERDEPVRHETTIINAGGERSGGGAVMLLLLVVLVLGVGAFLWFGGYVGGGKADRDINIEIKTPDININPPGGNSAQ